MAQSKDQLIQLDTLLESYNEYQDFDVRELSLIEPLRAMRNGALYRMGIKSAGRILLFQEPLFGFKSKTFGLNNSLYLKGQVECK